MNIYIAGDSYCRYREDPRAHWPRRLAERLDLQLHGWGFSGASWWPVREHILAYRATEFWDQTELFVIAHTQYQRPITANPNFKPNKESADRAWFAYIQSDPVQRWTNSKWFRELNTILQGRRVIHVPCFANPEFDLLDPVRVERPLLELSAESTDNDYSLMNRLPNHMTAAYNQRVAASLERVYRLMLAGTVPDTVNTL
jgi:hypothetical protein